ncbi:UNVERIFIED_CONTAM: hypothetical protein Sangu_0513200 [Sesamum angustifolium]|uniref:Uncharacterized protein n=1 Tax=Sesamum angustifolium TaxID=2727405 RepID=A0AAW2Q9A3_9LAMI
MQSYKGAEAFTLISHELSKLSKAQPQRSIYRVHKDLRDVNNKAYEPEIIAIGPYHRDKDNIRMMEEHKLWYLHLLLERKKENVETYISAMGELEQEARNCYAEPVSLNSAKFIKMLVLDSCFIIELVRKHDMRGPTCENDPIFEIGWIMNSLQRDIILFENQIPFFILCRLFDMIEGSNQRNMLIYRLLLFCESLYPGGQSKRKTNRSLKDIKHILDLIHGDWISSDEGVRVNTREWQFIHPVTELPDANEEVRLNVDEVPKPREDEVPKPREWKFIHPVTELTDANMAFKNKTEQTDANKASENMTEQTDANMASENMTEQTDANMASENKETNKFFKVHFDDGIMSMSHLTIEDGTELFFRNLIAYEQYFPSKTGPDFVTDYVTLLDRLINSSKDVEILSKCGIIDNWLGDNEVVANIFNRLGASVTIRGEHFNYATIFDSVNKHYKKRRNRAMAVLRRDYFNSPWSYFSFSAALVILLLTLAQTVLSTLQL